jgi:hypothetical protein
MLGERGEVAEEPFLRRPGVVGAGDKAARDRPRRRRRQSLGELARVAAGKPEINRAPTGEARCDDGDQPLALVVIEGEAFAGGGGKDDPVDGAVRIMPREAGERRLVERAVAKRRHQRQPEAGEARLARLRAGHAPRSPACGRRRPGADSNKKVPSEPAGPWRFLYACAQRVQRSPDPVRAGFRDLLTRRRCILTILG